VRVEPLPVSPRKLGPLDRVAQVDGPLLDEGDAEGDGGRVGVWLGPLDVEPPKVNLVAEVEEAFLPAV